MNHPLKAAAADVGPADKSVTRMDTELRAARHSAARLQVQLESAQSEARSAIEQVREAYAKGLTAESPQADGLRQSVARVQKALQDSERERSALSSALRKSEAELSEIRAQLGIVREHIEGMKSETENLRASLYEANRRIEQSATRHTELQAAVTVAEAQRDSREWWLWRVGLSLVVLLVLMAVYVAGRVQGWGWMR